LLPPHAPDMLTVRIQVIDGTGTFTLSDSQPCRLLTMLYDFSVSDLIDIHAFNGNRFVRWFYPAISADMSASRYDPGRDMVTFGNLADNCNVEVRIGRSNSPNVRLRAFDVTRYDEVCYPVQIARVYHLFDVTSDERLLITFH
jgi:hypothetical protein